MGTDFDITKAVSMLKSLVSLIVEMGALEDAGKKGESQVRFIITSDKTVLGVPGDEGRIYFGTCNLDHGVSKTDDENTVYLAHAFFNQPRREQLKILYFFMVSKLIKKLNQDDAMADAEKFVRAYYQ